MTTVNGTNSNNSTGSTGKEAANAALAALSSDFEHFLKLLTTQLQNQDPSNPMDTNQMTSQIAQLSMVQAQNQSNQLLASLLDAYSVSQTNSVVSYIGKRVEAEGNTSVMLNGAAQFTYDLDAPAAKVTITLSDEAGNVVYQGSTSGYEGRNTAVWDGSNSTTGNYEPDGAYTYTIVAEDADGKKVNSKTYTTGQVTAVNIQDGKTTLDLNGFYTMELEDVVKVGADPLYGYVPPTPDPDGDDTETEDDTDTTNT